MTKTILVIGSVTAKQYEAARIKVLAEGHKPKIVRVTVDDLRPDEEFLLDEYESGTMLTDFYEDDDLAEEVYRKCCLKHYEQYGDIASIVMPDDVYSRYCTGGSFRAPWFLNGYFDKTPLWRVHSTDYVEYIA